MRSSIALIGSVTVALPWAAVVLLTPKAHAAQETKPQATARPADDADRSLTIFPVLTTPELPIAKQPDGTTIDLPQRFAAVVGFALEKAGMKNVVMATSRFTPSGTNDMARVAQELGKFVRENPIATQFALYGELHGTAQTGVAEIRTVVVDNQGNIILADRDDKETYARTSSTLPKDPMTCCLFLSKKIQNLWTLPKPNPSDATEGKMAAYWRKQSGLPENEELEAIQRRRKILKAKASTGTLTVYPVRVGAESDTASAAQLAEMFDKARLAKTVLAKVDPRLQIPGDPNEQKILWDTARGFRRFLQKNPPSTDYALLADYGIGRDASGQTKVGYVHVIVCDQETNWVIVDFQNSHHADFQSIAPSSRADCNRLVMQRAQGLLSD